ncbi:MAG: rhodanese-related sulfurtransferase [Pseudomonadota bacterium]
MFTVAALYRFTAISDPAALRGPLHALCVEAGLSGTLLLATEGINGTVAGPRAGVDRLTDWIRTTIPDCERLDVKYSSAETNPFLRMKVRLKKEIVTMGRSDIDPRRSVGTYVSAQEWNALIGDPDTIVIDTRNDYEVAIGTFEGARDPKTRTFREFPSWAESALPTPNTRHGERDGNSTDRPQKIAMFCTGGIRCEKATAFLKQQGHAEVYHLEGGILRYLETVPPEESLWRGECFVFDQRVSVTHGLAEGSYDQCFACRHPLSEAEKKKPEYKVGVSCPRCFDRTSAERKSGLEERQRQIGFATARGTLHLGAPPQSVAADQPANAQVPVKSKKS